MLHTLTLGSTYHLILNHSQFLQIFLEESEDQKCDGFSAKGRYDCQY